VGGAFVTYWYDERAQPLIISLVRGEIVESCRALFVLRVKEKQGGGTMKKGLIITASIVGGAVSVLGVYHGVIRNQIDSGWILAAVGLSFTVTSAFLLLVDSSLNKRIDDLREDIKGIDQRLQTHRHS